MVLGEWLGLALFQDCCAKHEVLSLWKDWCDGTRWGDKENSDSDSRAGKGPLFTQDDNAVFAGDVALHEVLLGVLTV